MSAALLALQDSKNKAKAAVESVLFEQRKTLQRIQMAPTQQAVEAAAREQQAAQQVTQHVYDAGLLFMRLRPHFPRSVSNPGKVVLLLHNIQQVAQKLNFSVQDPQVLIDSKRNINHLVLILSHQLMELRVECDFDGEVTAAHMTHSPTPRHLHQSDTLLTALKQNDMQSFERFLCIARDQLAQLPSVMIPIEAMNSLVMSSIQEGGMGDYVTVRWSLFDLKICCFAPPPQNSLALQSSKHSVWMSIMTDSIIASHSPTSLPTTTTPTTMTEGEGGVGEGGGGEGRYCVAAMNRVLKFPASVWDHVTENGLVCTGHRTQEPASSPTNPVHVQHFGTLIGVVAHKKGGGMVHEVEGFAFTQWQHLAIAIKTIREQAVMAYLKEMCLFPSPQISSTPELTAEIQHSENEITVQLFAPVSQTTRTHYIFVIKPNNNANANNNNHNTNHSASKATVKRLLFSNADVQVFGVERNKSAGGEASDQQQQQEQQQKGADFGDWFAKAVGCSLDVPMALCYAIAKKKTQS